MLQTVVWTWNFDMFDIHVIIKSTSQLYTTTLFWPAGGRIINWVLQYSDWLLYKRHNTSSLVPTFKIPFLRLQVLPKAACWTLLRSPYVQRNLHLTELGCLWWFLRLPSCTSLGWASFIKFLFQIGDILNL